VTHEHRWKVTAHLDGCHYYTNVYGCTGCRATAQRSHERALKTDLYAGVWTEPQYREIRRDDKGRFTTPRTEEVVCDRCGELKSGAKVRVDLVVVGADGTIEREEHSEHEQEAAA
jgi:hypothetical protein